MGVLFVLTRGFPEKEGGIDPDEGTSAGNQAGIARGERRGRRYGTDPAAYSAKIGDVVSVEKIAYGLLSPREKQLYDRIEQGLFLRSAFLDLGGLGGMDVMKILQAVLGDNPGIVYFDKTKISLQSSLFGKEQVKLFTFPANQVRQMEKELDQAAGQVLERVLQSSLSIQYDTLLFLYEALQDHIVYDEEELRATQAGQSANPFSHNAYGALVGGQGVCDGIASAFALLAQRAGFSCTVIDGQASFRMEGFSNHAWNILKVGDRYYHVDPTWDLNQKSVTGEYSYTYFCVDENVVLRDHQWDPMDAPSCRWNDMSYYRKSRSIAHSVSELEDIFTRYTKTRSNVVRVKVEEGVALPTPEKEFLGKTLLRIATAVGRRTSIQYMWDENTRCFFAKFDG